jgi:hypothetical protein
VGQVHPPGRTVRRWTACRAVAPTRAARGSGSGRAPSARCCGHNVRGSRAASRTGGGARTRRSCRRSGRSWGNRVRPAHVALSDPQAARRINYGERAPPSPPAATTHIMISAVALKLRVVGTLIIDSRPSQRGGLKRYSLRLSTEDALSVLIQRMRRMRAAAAPFPSAPPKRQACRVHGAGYSRSREIGVHQLGAVRSNHANPALGLRCPAAQLWRAIAAHRRALAGDPRQHCRPPAQQYRLVASCPSPAVVDKSSAVKSLDKRFRAVTSEKATNCAIRFSL